MEKYPMGASAELAVVDELQLGEFEASRIDDDLLWGEGAIRPQEQNASQEQQHTVVAAAVQSIEDIAPDQKGMSGCTDGRRPIRLLNGDPVPARKQLVGGNLVSSFYVAEQLGEYFYSDPTKPVEDRIRIVAEFMADNGLRPSGHVDCGAGTGFGVVSANVPRFAQNMQYDKRTRLFLPDGVYDAQLRNDMMFKSKRRTEMDAYSSLHPQMFLDAIERVSGEHAIAELNDDGRGVHGHVEEAILRLRVGDCAVNEATLAETTGGREVFVINDDEMDKVAEIFGRGVGDDYRVARMAIEDFANSGHGTLAHGLPTWRIGLAA